jgi:DNA repair exonuclease SbcCD ATPase subunit
MPWTPILARLEGERQAQSNSPADLEQLIGLINASRQCLAELLRRLQPAGDPGRDVEGPEAGRAKETLAETLARLDRLAPAQPVATVRPEELAQVRATTEQLSSRLTSLDGAIEERMLRTADLAARGAEIAMQDRLKAVRGEVETVRRALAEVAADVRSALARQDAARGSEIGAVRTAIDGVRADLGRLDATLDGRVLAKVDAAWRMLDAELVRLRARIESIAASSAAGAWSLGRMVRDAIGALAGAAEFVLGPLVR